MASLLASARTQSSVRARVSYVVPGSAKPLNYMHPPPPGVPWSNCEFEAKTVAIRDAREFMLPAAVNICGFELVHSPTSVRNFWDPQEVEDVYYNEVREIALHCTGGEQAFVFDHQLRRREAGRPSLTFGREHGPIPGAVGRVHNDYTEISGLRRLEAVLGPQPNPPPAFCILNIWRSANGPVLDAPLALCDSRSVEPADLITGDLAFQQRLGEVYLARYSPYHRWAYFPELADEESIVFKQYDSRQTGVARFTLHAAFEHPQTPANAPLRESVEARVLVLFGTDDAPYG